MLRILLRSVLWGLAGGVLLPIFGILLMLVVMPIMEFFGSRCGGPGDSGGCAMGLASIVMMLVPIGAVSFLVVTFVRGIRARLNAEPVEGASE